MLDLAPHPALDGPDLDAQYNNRERVPEFTEHYARWQPLCDQVLAEFPCHRNVAYGASPREILDIVLPEGGGPHPVLVYIHGGYWMSRTKDDQTFIARAYAEAGIAFVLVEYDLMPDVRMADIVRQCRDAVAWVHAHAGDYGIDAGRLYVSGHSAGGHLTAMMAATDWGDHCGGPADMVKGGIALSGLYDLKPIQHSYLNDTLALTDAEVAANSPQLFDQVPALPVLVAVGGTESDAFHHQSQNLVNTWNAKGADCRYLNPPGRNHFTILAEFADPESELARATVEMVKS